jgi:hypothetical protein
MFYTRFGSRVELLAYAGKHERKGYPHPMMLVKIRFVDEEGLEGYYFAHNLRADGGINAIHAAIDALPQITLTDKELRANLKDAE